MNGAKIAVKCLAEQGVTQVFAYPGASEEQLKKEGLLLSTEKEGRMLFYTLEKKSERHFLTILKNEKK